MNERRTIKLSEWLAELKAQGVPKQHLAFKCPVCGTIQSAYDLIKAGAGKDFDEIEKYLGFSCVGRFTDAGPYRKGKSPEGKGCDWSLGGLFQLHELEVVDDEGKIHPRFVTATKDEAVKHMEDNLRTGPTIVYTPEEKAHVAQA